MNVGLPREVTWRGKTITTGIYKEPVAGPIPLRTLNLDGDRQADLRVHGGRDKAVYAYPSEFYALWRAERPAFGFRPGTFGENLTTEGLLDEDVSVGDRFRIGTAELVVTQPRLPCFKLGLRFGDPFMLKRFARAGRTGTYLRIVQEGVLEAGQPIEVSEPPGHGVTVALIAAAFHQDRRLAAKMLDAPQLPGHWRAWALDPAAPV